MRTCDGCGTKMPAFKPRQRDENGDLLCEGCANGRPGRPVGHHGSLVCADCFAPMGEAGMVVTAGRATCAGGCKKTAATWFENAGGEYYDTEVPGVGEAHVRMELSGNPLTHTGRWEWETYPYDGPGTTGMADTQDEAKTMALESLSGNQISLFGSLKKQAHDSGDGATIYHCPFCGAGQVTARSDGTVECGFCNSFFTVQVQPQHAAMPQTNPHTGQPLNMPGMPGDPATHVAPTPTPKPEEANFAPEGTGGDEGFAPAGTQGAQFLPAGSGNHTRAASRKTAEIIQQPHCSGCGSTNPDRYGPLEDGYTACCNEPLAWPGDCARCDHNQHTSRRTAGMLGDFMRNSPAGPQSSTFTDGEVALLGDLEVVVTGMGEKNGQPTVGYRRVDAAPGDREQWCYADEVTKKTSRKTAYERDDERHDPQEGDEPCTCCGGSGEHPSGHECYRCDASGLERNAAGECDAQTLSKGALYLTPDGVAVPEKSYLAHLALRFADDRDAVLTEVRNERTAR